MVNNVTGTNTHSGLVKLIESGAKVDPLRAVEFRAHQGGIVTTLDHRIGKHVEATPHIDGFIDGRQYVLTVEQQATDDPKVLQYAPVAYEANGRLHSQRLEDMDAKTQQLIAQDWKKRTSLTDRIYGLALANINQFNNEDYCQEDVYAFPLGEHTFVFKLEESNLDTISNGFLESRNPLYTLKPQGIVDAQGNVILQDTPLGANLEQLQEIYNGIAGLPTRDAPLAFITERSQTTRDYVVDQRMRATIDTLVNKSARTYDLAKGLTTLDLGEGLQASVLVKEDNKPPKVEVQSIMYGDTTISMHTSTPYQDIRQAYSAVTERLGDPTKRVPFLDYKFKE